MELLIVLLVVGAFALILKVCDTSGKVEDD
jgi:hypothetical protein